MLRPWFLLLLLMFLPSGVGHAQETQRHSYWDEHAQILFERIGRDNGLPSDIVTAIVQDRAGFVWVGTPVGLTRYDGYRFRVFQPDSRDPSSLPDGYVNALYVDRRGRLWVGTNNGGVARFVPETEGFVRYPSGPGGLAHPTAYRFTEDMEGNIWVALRSGLARLDAQSGTAENFRTQDGSPDGLPGTIVQDILHDATGVLWVGTDAGLVLRQPQGGGFVPVNQVLRLPSLPAGTAVSALFKDGRGRIWIGTRDGLLICYDPASGIARSFDTAGAEGHIADRPHVRAIQDLAVAGDPRDRIWIATDPGGLVELDVDTGTVRSIHHDPAVRASVSNDAVRALLRDRSGLIWVATWGGGVNLHNPANQGVLSVFSSPVRPESPSEPQVRAVLSAHDGRLWLGYETKGIDIIDPAMGVRERLVPGQGAARELPRANVLALAEDTNNTVWIGTQLGLARFDPTIGRVTAADLPGALARLPVYAIMVRDGELWLASEGLIRFNPRTRAITQYRHDPEDDTTLADDRVRVLCQAPDGRVWVGTHRGLHLLNPETGHIRRVQNRSWDWSSLAHNYVTSLLYDRQGHLWIGTLGGGISMLDSDLTDERYRFLTLSQRHGLPGDSVQAMVLDDAGKVWVNTEDGLARIDPETRVVTAIGWDDGLGVRGTWGGSAARLPDGALIFGGREGLTLVRPDVLRQWAFQPPLVLTDLRIDNDPMPVSALNLLPSIVDPIVGMTPKARAPSTPASILMPAGARTLTVGFAALDYAGPSSLRYSYRLEGFDKGWVEVDALGRQATYTNLPPGTYNLRLRATNKEGIWGRTDRTVGVTVLPSWYQTRLAEIGAAVIILAALGLVIQMRTAALRRQRRWLEQLVAQRTQDLVAANAELARLASTDGLTGLLNRRRFEEMVVAEIDRARRYGRPFSLLLVDLDHFKQVNDRYGHNAGDAALRAAAQRMMASVRTTDVVGRYGGEELAVLLPETPQDEAWRVAERIRQTIGGSPVQHDGNAIAITASVGGVEYCVADDGVAPLIGRADAALYRAKQEGRDRVRFNDDGGIASRRSTIDGVVD